jgi:hypothetical protein
MHSEPAVLPRNIEPAVDSVCATCAGSSMTAVLAPERPYLRLVSMDTSDTTTMRDAESASFGTPRTRPTSDDIASPPLAEPLEAAASALWASPAEVLGLLAAASEHRRVVDLIWNASQIGALQLPPSLIAAMERARASWPQVLPISC